MEQTTVHRVLALGGGVLAAAVVWVSLPEPGSVAIAGALWALGLAGVLRGYRTFPEWAADAELSRLGYLVGVGAVALVKGIVVFGVTYRLLAAPLGDAVWMSVSLAAVVLVAAGIGVVLFAEESEAGNGEGAAF